jgi:hypothetical protein
VVHVDEILVALSETSLTTQIADAPPFILSCLILNEAPEKGLL